MDKYIHSILAKKRELDVIELNNHLLENGYDFEEAQEEIDIIKSKLEKEIRVQNHLKNNTLSEIIFVLKEYENSVSKILDRLFSINIVILGAYYYFSKTDNISHLVILLVIINFSLFIINSFFKKNIFI
tara:strand:+ start:191 stop:577 length:387 start_codon:yes stop_codon:yes gene_type:complete